MVVLDTDVIIDHLRLLGSKDSALVKLAEDRPKEDFAISMITIQELYEGRSTKQEEIEHYLLSTVSPMAIFPYTFEIAKKAGEIARDLDRPIGLADCAIASTAIVNRAQLFTLNKRHFLGIKDLELSNIPPPL